ncbi:MAG: DNA-binding protein [Desulfovibrionaceae bacterium]|jgi:predicted DNA-binding protein with PD1-like motif|nr:DNA-binding protein [Desulfovibrionaceae bacterium]
MTDVFMGRLPKGADLVEALNALCAERKITRGTVQCIGALTRARLAFYRQDRFTYAEREVAEPMEIVSGQGNVSIRDGMPFVHLHLVLSDETFRCMGGHALPGCEIFACETVITPLAGPALVRTFDAPTRLPLWEGSWEPAREDS